jgi:hypothetical protein
VQVTASQDILVYVHATPAAGDSDDGGGTMERAYGLGDVGVIEEG